MGETNIKADNTYMSFATTSGDWQRVQLRPDKINVTSEATLHINAKDITLNVDSDTNPFVGGFVSDTNPFVGGTISIPLNINKNQKDWLSRTFLNEKENKKMSDIKLLEIYRERAKEKIDDDYVTERYKILKEDTIQNIIEEMENQVNAILESEQTKAEFQVRKDYMVTKETQEKLNKLDKDTKLKNEKLSNTIGEIYAMFELTENYEERMKILKKYGIINKDGKLGA